MNIRCTLMLVAVVGICGCKIRTISEGKPPRDGVFKTTRPDFFSRQKNGLDVEEHYRDGKVYFVKAMFDNGITAYELHNADATRGYDSTISFYRNGQTRVIMTWRDTTRIYYREYYENGLCKTKADTQTNEEFFENGNRKTTAVFNEGQIVKVTRWFPNGKIKDESQWRNDKRHGKWIEWDSAGTMIRNEQYRNGEKM